MAFRVSTLRLPAIAFVAVSLGAVVAQDTEAPAPARPAPADVAGQGRENDPVTLQRRLVAVGEALATANAELATLREQHAQLTLRMEALGFAAVKGDERSTQRRLLKAAADLQASETARAEITEKANRLAEAAAAYMAKPGEPVVKTSLEETVKAVTSSKPARQIPPVPVESALVVSYKTELGLAVINAGSDSGVRMGAPMIVSRADRTVGHGLVVDVRDRISGVLLTGATPAAVRVGDSVKPEIEQSQPAPKK